MATGGWGGTYSNPFAGQAAGGAAAAAADQAADGAAAATRQSGAFGAWGAGVGSAAPSAPAAPAYANAYSAPAAQAAPTGDLTAREAALARREEELLRREAALASAGASLKNWPPCCPVLYHNIGDVPSWNRSMVRFTYLVELVTLAAFFYNAIIILATLFARTGPGLQWWFLSVLALTLGGPLSWWMFYRSVFNAACTDGATYTYMRTLVLILLHMAWAVWMLLGLPNLGAFSAGVFPMLDLFQQGGSKGVAFGILFCINVGLWGVVALGCWVVLGLAVAAYRRGDGPRRDYEARVGGVQMRNV